MDTSDFTNDMHHIANHYDVIGKHHTRSEKIAHAIKALALVNELTTKDQRITTLEEALREAAEKLKLASSEIEEGYQYSFDADEYLAIAGGQDNETGK